MVRPSYAPAWWRSNADGGAGAGAYCVLMLTSLYILFWMWKARGLNKAIVALHCLLFVACTLHFALEFNHFYTYLVRSSYLSGEAAGLTEAVVGRERRRRLWRRGLPHVHCGLHRLGRGFPGRPHPHLQVLDHLGRQLLDHDPPIPLLRRRSEHVLSPPPSLPANAFTIVCSAVVGHLVWGTTGATVSPAIVPLGLASFVLPLCTNVLVTGLIVGRIWRTSRGAGLYALGRGGATRKAAHIVVESGALYFAVQLVFVVLYGLNAPSASVLIAVAVQTYVRGAPPALSLLPRGADARTRRASRRRSSSSTSASASPGSRRPGPRPSRASRGPSARACSAAAGARATRCCTRRAPATPSSSACTRRSTSTTATTRRRRRSRAGGSAGWTAAQRAWGGMRAMSCEEDLGRAQSAAFVCL